MLTTKEVVDKIDIQKILSNLDPSIQPIVISPNKIKMNSRAPSLVKRQTSAAAVPNDNPITLDNTPAASTDDSAISDQLAKLKEENAKLKTKLKREEESRKHWQETCKKREEEITEAKKEKDAIEKTIEAERANAKKYQAQLVAKSERVKYLEKKEGKAGAVPEEQPKVEKPKEKKSNGGG